MIRCLGPGVRVTWATLPGKPAMFAPAPHTHAYADLTGIPATFSPSAHTHAWTDITGKPTTFAPSAHSHAWSEITSKPTTFAPSAHTHLWADITDRPTIPAATPLSDAAPVALAKTAAAGTAISAARADHIHPLPAGNWELLKTASIGETGLLMLNLATKRYTVAVSGAALTDRIGVALNGIPQNGIVQDAYVSVAGTVSVGVLLPALGVAATVAVPIAIYRIT